MKKPRLVGKKVRCWKCSSFKSESNVGFCKKFGWLIDSKLARHHASAQQKRDCHKQKLLGLQPNRLRH